MHWVSDSFCKYRNVFIVWGLLHILKNVCVFSISFKATFRLLLSIRKQENFYSTIHAVTAVISPFLEIKWLARLHVVMQGHSEVIWLAPRDKPFPTRPMHSCTTAHKHCTHGWNWDHIQHLLALPAGHNHLMWYGRMVSHTHYIVQCFCKWPSFDTLTMIELSTPSLVFSPKSWLPSSWIMKQPGS